MRFAVGVGRSTTAELDSEIHAAVERIYALAKGRGWTIEKLAGQARGNFRSFNNWRQGHTAPSLPKLAPFAAAVGARLRVIVETADESGRGGMTPEAAEVAEYLNAIPDATLRAQVRDATRRFIETFAIARKP